MNNGISLPKICTLVPSARVSPRIDAFSINKRRSCKNRSTSFLDTKGGDDTYKLPSGLTRRFRVLMGLRRHSYSYTFSPMRRVSVVFMIILRSTL